MAGAAGEGGVGMVAGAPHPAGMLAVLSGMAGGGGGGIAGTGGGGVVGWGGGVVGSEGGRSGTGDCPHPLGMPEGIAGWLGSVGGNEVLLLAGLLGSWLFIRAE